VVLNELGLLSTEDSTISIVEVLKILLREFKLHLPLLVFLVVLIVAVLLRRLIHFHELEEDAILLQLRKFFVLSLDASNFVVGMMHEAQGVLRVLWGVNKFPVFLQDNQIFNQVLFRVEIMRLLGLVPLLGGRLRARDLAVQASGGRLFHHPLTALALELINLTALLTSLE
jgi:hypothetical protein